LLRKQLPSVNRPVEAVEKVPKQPNERCVERRKALKKTFSTASLGAVCPYFIYFQEPVENHRVWEQAHLITIPCKYVFRHRLQYLLEILETPYIFFIHIVTQHMYNLLQKI
jgi:hypothetical protein